MEGDNEPGTKLYDRRFGAAVKHPTGSMAHKSFHAHTCGFFGSILFFHGERVYHQKLKEIPTPQRSNFRESVE